MSRVKNKDGRAKMRKSCGLACRRHICVVLERFGEKEKAFSVVPTVQQVDGVSTWHKTYCENSDW